MPLGEKAIAQYDDFYLTVYDLYDIYTPPDICQTPQDIIQTLSDTHTHHPDTPQTQSSHPQAWAILCNTEHRNKRQYLSILTKYDLFADRFGTNTSPDTLIPHPDNIQTPRDTIQKPPDKGVFM